MKLIAASLFASLIGIALSFYAVRAVIWVYKFKNTPNATVARIAGVSSVAVLAPISGALPGYIFWGGSDQPLIVSASFTVSVILGLVFFFWRSKAILDELYYK